MIINKFEWSKDLNEQDILNMEAACNIELPEDYKSFLLVNNGGSVTGKAFTFLNKSLYPNLPEGQLSQMKYFYSADKDVAEDNKIYTITENIRYREGRLPKETISVGTDEAGNEILLCVSNENSYRKVFYWDHELEKDIPGFENCTLLANSFAEFLELL